MAKNQSCVVTEPYALPAIHGAGISYSSFPESATKVQAIALRDCSWPKSPALQSCWAGTSSEVFHTGVLIHFSSQPSVPVFGVLWFRFYSTLWVDFFSRCDIYKSLRDKLFSRVENNNSCRDADLFCLTARFGNQSHLFPFPVFQPLLRLIFAETDSQYAGHRAGQDLLTVVTLTTSVTGCWLQS